jgi:hypothetical protein
MDTKYALTWVEWLHRRQDGEGDQSTWFTFRVVHTLSLNSIPPNCQASRKSKIQKGSSEVWQLEYDGCVEHCQVGGEIWYPQESIDYEDYLKKQAVKSGPSKPHLLGLPCQNRLSPSWKLKRSFSLKC